MANEAIEDTAIEAVPEYGTFNTQIYTGYDDEIYSPPKLIKLTTVNSGEARYMKQKNSNSTRFHKIKDKNSHEWFYPQLLLYHSFQQESVDLKKAIKDKKICEDMFLYPEKPDLISKNEPEIRNSMSLRLAEKICYVLKMLRRQKNELLF